MRVLITVFLLASCAYAANVVCRSPPPPTCTANQQSTLNTSTGCYNCIPSNGRPSGSNCTQDSLKKCTTGIRACGKDERPTRTGDCCVSCIPTPQQNSCSSDNDSRCNQVPACQGTTLPTFNSTTCCPSCKPRVVPPSGNSTNSGGAKKCTKDDVETCISVVPVCDVGEKPTINNSSCCPSCRRAQTQCTPVQVAQCLNTSVICKANETSVVPEGECCPSCVQPKQEKTCTSCKDGERCVFKFSNFSNAPASVCRPSAIVRLALNLTGGDSSPLLNFTASDFLSAVTEVVARFCDNNDSDMCAKFRAQNYSVDADVRSISKNRTHVMVDLDASSATDTVPTRSSTQSVNNGLSYYADRGIFSVSVHHVRHALASSSPDSTAALISAAFTDSTDFSASVTVTAARSTPALSSASTTSAGLAFSITAAALVLNRLL